MSAFNRRAVLAGIASIPAVALPAVVSATALASSSALSPAIPEPAVTLAVTPAEPDPIFAAIVEHRRLWSRYIRAIDRFENAESKTDKRRLKAESHHLERAEYEALWALGRIRPTTAAGAGALIVYVRDDLKDGQSDWQLAALANAAKALRGMGAEPLRPAAALDADPIYALIEEHRAADAYWCTLNEEDDEKAYNAAGDAASALASVLGKTQPTTLAGVLAIVRYRRVHDAAFPGYHLFIPEGSEGENTDPGQRMNNWLATIEQSIAAIAGAAVS